MGEGREGVTPPVLEKGAGVTPRSLPTTAKFLHSIFLNGFFPPPTTTAAGG